MQLIIPKTQHNFYESFSDLIFNALVLFLILILFLVLKINAESKMVKQDYADKLKIVEAKVGMIDGSYVETLESEKKKLKTVNWELLNKNVDLQSQQEALIVEKQKISVEKKTLELEFTALKDKVNKNHNVTVDLNTFTGGSYLTMFTFSWKKRGDSYIYSPVPVKYSNELRSVYGDPSQAEACRRIKSEYFSLAIYYSYDDMRKIFSSIKHASRIRGTPALKGQVIMIPSNWLSYHVLEYQSESEYLTYFESNYDKICFMDLVGTQTGSLGESPVLQFSTVGNKFTIGGVEMSDSQFIWFISAFSCSEIKFKYVGEKETDMIPEWAKSVLNNDGYKTH